VTTNTRPGVFLRAVHDDNLICKFEVREHALLIAREVEKKAAESARHFKLQFANYYDVDPSATERLRESGESDGALSQLFKRQILGPLVMAHRPSQNFFPFWAKEDPIPYISTYDRAAEPTASVGRPDDINTVLGYAYIFFFC